VAYANAVEKVPDTKIVVVEKRWPLFVRLSLYTFRLLRASSGADVLYVQNAVAVGLPAVIVSYLRHIPMIVTFDSDEAWERALQLRQTTKKLEDFLLAPECSPYIKLLMNLQGFVLRHAHIVTTPSAYLAQEIIRIYHIPQERTFVNYDAPEKSIELPFRIQITKHQIATTGRLSAWKGVDGIIRAVKILKKDFPDVKLLIAGDGPEESNLKKLAATLEISDHIVFLGQVTRAQTWHVRKTSEVYVLNSSAAGVPRSILTNFAAKIPTIATSTPGIDEVIYHEKTGLPVPVGDDQALADAIGRLFTNPDLAQKIVAGGEKILNEKFSWDTHLKNLLTLFESVRTKPRH
jgi:glycosyltransferase involved in cell wall biosynthesis